MERGSKQHLKKKWGDWIILLGQFIFFYLTKWNKLHFGYASQAPCVQQVFFTITFLPSLSVHRKCLCTIDIFKLESAEREIWLVEGKPNKEKKKDADNFVSFWYIFVCWWRWERENMLEISKQFFENVFFFWFKIDICEKLTSLDKSKPKNWNSILEI